MKEYTVAGYPITDCPTEHLTAEAEAGWRLRNSGASDSGNWYKLSAVEAELAKRQVS